MSNISIFADYIENNVRNATEIACAFHTISEVKKELHERRVAEGIDDALTQKLLDEAYKAALETFDAVKVVLNYKKIQNGYYAAINAYDACVDQEDEAPAHLKMAEHCFLHMKVAYDSLDLLTFRHPMDLFIFYYVQGLIEEVVECE
jgi:putative IMPACT (imprinted ancient) family translation regulator